MQLFLKNSSDPFFSGTWLESYLHRKSDTHFSSEEKNIVRSKKQTHLFNRDFSALRYDRGVTTKNNFGKVIWIRLVPPEKVSKPLLHWRWLDEITILPKFPGLSGSAWGWCCHNLEPGQFSEHLGSSSWSSLLLKRAGTELINFGNNLFTFELYPFTLA